MRTGKWFTEFTDNCSITFRTFKTLGKVVSRRARETSFTPAIGSKTLLTSETKARGILAFHCHQCRARAHAFPTFLKIFRQCCGISSRRSWPVTGARLCLCSHSALPLPSPVLCAYDKTLFIAIPLLYDYKEKLCECANQCANQCTTVCHTQAIQYASHNSASKNSVPIPTHILTSHFLIRFQRSIRRNRSKFIIIKIKYLVEYRNKHIELSFQKIYPHELLIVKNKYDSSIVLTWKCEFSIGIYSQLIMLTMI